MAKEGTMHMGRPWLCREMAKPLWLVPPGTSTRPPTRDTSGSIPLPLPYRRLLFLPSSSSNQSTKRDQTRSNRPKPTQTADHRS